jgi:hypothetical protein
LKRPQTALLINSLLLDVRNHAMKSWTKACWATLIAASFVAGAHADDAAIVHITDRPAPVPDPGPGAPATPSANGAVVGTTTGAPCDGGACNGGGSMGGSCLDPTRGFRPYASAPVYREAVVYYRYWPDKWYGDPSFNLRPMFPQVYMPTDTTQQGFYYARVPQWMPNPNMYPPAPRPEDWHRHVVYAGGGGACGNVGAGVDVGTPVPASSGPTPAQPGTNGVPSPPPPTTAPAPNPSAMMQNGQIQPAAATGERHYLLDDISNFFSPKHPAQMAPAQMQMPEQSANVPPAPAPAQ